MVSLLAFGSSCPTLDSQCSTKKSEGKVVNGAEVNQWRSLEKSGCWLENVDLTHLVSS